jgi:hypothetical protein
MSAVVLSRIQERDDGGGLGGATQAPAEQVIARGDWPLDVMIQLASTTQQQVQTS